MILHPFSEPDGPAKLIDGSRASLILQGILPGEKLTAAELEKRLLDGRYCELSMLFYVGKDVLRWAHQCMEAAERAEDAREGVRPESFIALLVEDTPAAVEQKLRRWGVHEYKRIFSRGLGLHAIFERLPEQDLLCEDFIRYYYRFADELFAWRQRLFPFTRIRAADAEFELYASAEYSKLLERQWEET